MADIIFYEITLPLFARSFMIAGTQILYDG